MTRRFGRRGAQARQEDITRSGRPVGVLLSLTDYEGLIETLEILADQDLAKSNPASRFWWSPSATGATSTSG